jgi:hypothetical protein
MAPDLSVKGAICGRSHIAPFLECWASIRLHTHIVVDFAGPRSTTWQGQRQADYNRLEKIDHSQGELT